MNTSLREQLLKTKAGSFYVKEWLPDKLTSEIPVVLLHDSLGSVDLWRDFPAALATKLQRKVIAYDRLGFGKSDSRSALPSIQFIEQEASHYFPLVKLALGLKEFALLGHSVGGAMAVNIAATDKDCMALITISAQAYVEDLTIAGIKQGKQLFQSPEQLNRLKKWHGNKAEWVLNAWTEVWLSDDFSSWSLAGVIEQVDCPVLAIHGELDEYGSDAFPRFIAEKTASEGNQLLLRDCGHMPHKEQTQQVLSAVESFISNIC